MAFNNPSEGEPKPSVQVDTQTLPGFNYDSILSDTFNKREQAQSPSQLVVPNLLLSDASGAGVKDSKSAAFPGESADTPNLLPELGVVATPGDESHLISSSPWQNKGATTDSAPVQQKDKLPATEKPVDSAVKLDKDGWATDVQYPGQQKSRHFERDPKTHEVISMTTKTADATTILVKRDGRWALSMQGLELPFSGDLKVSKEGDVSLKTGAADGWTVEKTDGSKRILQLDGSSLEYGPDNQVIKAIRGDKERSFSRGNAGLTVVDRNTKTNESRVVFDEKLAGAANIHVSDKGDLSYRNTNGTAVIERANGLRLDLDKDGDMTSVTSDQGTRRFSYLGSGESKALGAVSDAFKTAKGEFKQTFTRVLNRDGTLSTEFRSDKTGVPSRYNIEVRRDGDYEFTTTLGKLVNSKVER